MNEEENPNMVDVYWCSFLRDEESIVVEWLWYDSDFYIALFLRHMWIGDLSSGLTFVFKREHRISSGTK